MKNNMVFVKRCSFDGIESIRLVQKRYVIKALSMGSR